MRSYKIRLFDPERYFTIYSTDRIPTGQYTINIKDADVFNLELKTQIDSLEKQLLLLKKKIGDEGK